MMRIELTLFLVALWEFLYHLGEQLIQGCQRIKQQGELYYIRYRTREHLRGLSPEQLRDVGLTQRQAQEEQDKPFWK